MCIQYNDKQLHISSNNQLRMGLISSLNVTALQLLQS